MCTDPVGRGIGVKTVGAVKGPVGRVTVVREGVGKVVGGRVFMIGVELVEVAVQIGFALFWVAHSPRQPVVQGVRSVSSGISAGQPQGTSMRLRIMQSGTAQGGVGLGQRELVVVWVIVGQESCASMDVGRRLDGKC